ncbi:sensor histidine kinase [Egicoccus sp. AB-alg2]|uniref:sensor histidine kinase n=1 Tax=Egicoccus sp. AB-alg2 TaxID=3242693 RepID=UPI00359DDA7D
MRIGPAYRLEAALAAGCVASDALLLAAEGLGPVLSAPLSGLVVLGFRRAPLVAGLSTAGLHLLRAALGVPAESPAGMAVFLIVAYALGRYADRAGGLAVAGVLAAAQWATDPTLATGLFVVVLVGTIWVCGYLVRRRTLGAEQAAEVAAELAATDPQVTAAQVVAEERARLAGEALRTIRAAVVGMAGHAEQAGRDLDRSAMVAIQQQGRDATTELRRLLGLLRTEADVADPPPAPRPPPRWRTDLATAAAVAVLYVGEMVLYARLDVAPERALGGLLGVVLAGGFVASLALRRTDPLLACLAAALAPAGALILGQPLPYGLWSAAVFMLLAWSAAGERSRRACGALSLLAVLVLADVYHDEPDNVVMTSALLALAAVAGHVWTARQREERSSEATATSLKAQHDAIAAAAVQSERLRLARELHDVASHAVGVMVLQAGAAAALAARAPAQAREALATVRSTGADAQVELDMLFGLLDAGAVGAAGLAASPETSGLDDALHALAGRIEAAGLTVSLGLPERLPHDPPLAATIYRIVQEALTNATRYAPGAAVQVTVADQDGILEVIVRDDGPGHEPAIPSAGGFGLVGLAERVRALRGTVTAGPASDRGFVVTARLPLDRPAPQVQP